MRSDFVEDHVLDVARSRAAKEQLVLLGKD